MKKLFVTALILCVASCCERHKLASSNANVLMNFSKNDFRVYAKDVHSVYFEFNKAVIKDEGIARVNKLISQLKKVQHIKLVMHGYTDRVGQESYNHKLAMRRINAVKTMLIHSGVITANHITIETKALGQHDPLISYNTINNNPKSRRVDVYITRP
jgi:outer membrane protein OmpA-like peptidoglycan-associated protein